MTTFVASGPFSPSRGSYSTFAFSARVLNPSPAMFVWCTKRSFPPSSGVMNPYPFASLTHFTVPVAINSTSLTTHERTRRQSATGTRSCSAGKCIGLRGPRLQGEFCRAQGVGAHLGDGLPPLRSLLVQRDVVDQRVRGIGRIPVVVDVEPEDDRPPADARRELEALPRPRSRVRADVEDGC